ncbi:single-stranded DNA-binding protein [Lysinibacillus sp. LZ02]|uniref:single-stranded DNA-binding protein n=1 Tax=Lysinibacillus sp. LZ02 TaxID=3420668 RepID=UPI003D36E751
MNQVGLVGRLTKDPVLRQLSDNKITVSFVIAINRNFRNTQGGVDADYLLCIAWGKLAERIAKYCGKGSLIGVSGRLQSKTYVNKENSKVYTTEVVVEDVRFFALKQREEQLASEASAYKGTQEIRETPLEEHFVLPSEEQEVEVNAESVTGEHAIVRR